MFSLCVFVCMPVCIKGCFFQWEIQFEESNLIRGYRGLTGQCVLKWVSGWVGEWVGGEGVEGFWMALVTPEVIQ